MSATATLQQIQKGKANITLVSKLPSMKVAPETGGKMMQVFLNSDLRNGHDGLADLAKENNIDVSKLQPGQYVAFINAGRDRLKLFTANNVVAYYKTRPGEILDLRTISNIPRAFNASGRIDYDSALKTTIEQALARRRRNPAE